MKQRPWTPEDFQHVILEKNLDFDYHVDASELISDKSIIPSLDQWVYEYDRQAHRILHGRLSAGPPQTSKSAYNTLSRTGVCISEEDHR